MIRPVGNRLIIQVVKDDTVTASGFVVKDPDTLSTTKCQIITIGNDVTRKWNLGDIVLVPKQAFIEARENLMDQTIAISEDDVIAVIEPDTEAE